MQINNPLEQFDIIIWVTFYKFFSLSTFSFTFILNLSFVLFIIFSHLPSFNILKKKNTVFVIKKKSLLLFLTYTLLWLVNKIIKDNIFVKKNSFLFNFYFLFLTVLISNIVGMLPSSHTVTSHLIVTLFFSFTFFIGINIIGILRHREKFFGLFLPEGVPIIITPLLIIIEYISYFSRVLSLSIRLFANMMSGHILMKILIGFSWTILSVNHKQYNAWLPLSTVFTLFSFFPFLIVFAVIFLEIAISFLQAYVFIVLLTIYLNDAIILH